MAERKESPGRVRFIVINIIRVMLVLAFFGAIYEQRILVMYISLVGFTLTFLPYVLEKWFNMEVPAKYEILILFFIYGVLYLGEVRGLFDEFWWWDILLNFVSAIALGFIGLTLMYVLYKDDKINASPMIIVFFAFAFAVAIGSVWEIFEYGLDSIFGFNLQKSMPSDTMGDLIFNSLGAFLVSVAGYFYIKNGRMNVVSTFITKLVEGNSRFFNPDRADSSEMVMNMIKKGESEILEFKSTLRVNLHTNEVDRKVEHSALKTITAYLNSRGGVLLIGVSDDKELIGIEKDNFSSQDKLVLHFTNLIKRDIGSEYLPFIKFEIVQVHEMSVLKVECKSSRRPVFLRGANEEEFYVRNGPSSTRLSGSSLVSYISHHFRNN
ncbi:hypothetical protein COU60_03510 [Candidatus Pacearchaeota archaeon CG10_big_fil_rev_8_21_14_0_10_34_76]|nr:MAG: hypothetical protein COU60_03510 [Candidatus Pacearchaeota archaeon CG10_big_fil_rev_8_21_14_0_10_34_76]